MKDDRQQRLEALSDLKRVVTLAHHVVTEARDLEEVVATEISLLPEPREETVAAFGRYIGLVHEAERLLHDAAMAIARCETVI